MDAKAGRLGLMALACGAILAPSTASAGMSANIGGPAHAASSGCKSQLKGEPCLGPLNSSYSFAGLGGGDLGYLSAKPGPQKIVGTRFETEPFPMQDQVLRRVFTWHSRADVTIEAVFAVHRANHGYAYRFQRLPTGPHSGHATITGIRDYDLPMLVLQGRRS